MKKFGFTLAEVLITLSVIGIVAAMTLPTLIQANQKKHLEVATQKFYSMMSQAVQKYMADEGVSDLRHTALAGDNYEDERSDEAFESIRNFVTKYLKVVQECEPETNTCFATTYKRLTGENFSSSDSLDSHAKHDYVLADGSVIRMAYWGNSSYHSPIDLYVDVNGKKGPNKVGFDLWNMSIFYDGVIDEGSMTPECRNKGICSSNVSGSTSEEIRKNRFQYCKDGTYGGCFGHFMENGFKFDY